MTDQRSIRMLFAPEAFHHFPHLAAPLVPVEAPQSVLDGPHCKLKSGQQSSGYQGKEDSRFAHRSDSLVNHVLRQVCR